MDENGIRERVIQSILEGETPSRDASYSYDLDLFRKTLGIGVKISLHTSREDFDILNLPQGMKPSHLLGPFGREDIQVCPHYPLISYAAEVCLGISEEELKSAWRFCGVIRWQEEVPPPPGVHFMFPQFVTRCRGWRACEKVAQAIQSRLNLAAGYKEAEEFIQMSGPLSLNAVTPELGMKFFDASAVIQIVKAMTGFVCQFQPEKKNEPISETIAWIRKYVLEPLQKQAVDTCERAPERLCPRLSHPY